MEQESLSVICSSHCFVTQSLDDCKHSPSTFVDFQCIPGSCRKTSLSKKSRGPFRKTDKTLACFDLSKWGMIEIISGTISSGKVKDSPYMLLRVVTCCDPRCPHNWKAKSYFGHAHLSGCLMFFSVSHLLRTH